MIPMTFTDDDVKQGLKMRGLPLASTAQENRERLASHVEEKYRDFVEGWEVRTGRPWTSMTPEEAGELVEKHPHLVRNPGVLLRLFPGTVKRI